MSEQQSEANRRRDEYVLEMINAQPRLHAYVFSLVLDREKAQDILQQANVVLLEKQHEFQPGTNFGAWACRVAYYAVLADRRARQRDRHVFSDEFLSLVAPHAELGTADIQERTAALSVCLDRLSEAHRDLIASRYGPGGSVAKIATQLDKTPNAVSAMLHRIRRRLMNCIEKNLAGVN